MSNLKNMWSMLKLEHYLMVYELSKKGIYLYFEKVEKHPYFK